MRQFVFLALVLFASLASATNGEFEDELRDGFRRFLANGGHKEGALVDYLPEEAKFIPGYLNEYLFGSMRPRPKPAQSEVLCSACTLAMDTLIELLDGPIPPDSLIRDVLIAACSALNIVSPDVCDGAINNYWPSITYMQDNDDTLTGGRVCGILLGDATCGPQDELQWTVSVPPGKPPVQEPQLPNPGNPKSRILHITDIHLDLDYTLGNAGVDCGSPMCCSSQTSGVANSAEQEAGYWGDGICDTPEWTFRDMLTQIKNTHMDIDFIIMTGDFPPHNVWQQSKEYNINHAETGLDIIKEIFPDTPMFPAVGNHESYPANGFPTSDVTDPAHSLSDMYNALADKFAYWIPSADLNTFRQNGFYSTQARPGLRVITLNTMFQYTLNFWLSFHWVDPAGQLNWLANELLDAEQSGDKVYILGHMGPGGSQTYGTWGRELAKIVDRFESTIVAQFYGHTHNDEYKVFYDQETNSRPISVGFISPSVTSWENLNPAYRIFTIDGDYEGSSHQVLDIDTYMAYLHLANQQPGVSPEYFLLYNTREEYGFENLFPDRFDLLARMIAESDPLWERFYSLWASLGSEPTPRREIICELVTVSNLDERKCNEIMGPELD